MVNSAYISDSVTSGGQQYKVILAEAAQATYAKGLAISGNEVIGFRLPDSNVILITPVELSFKEIHPGDICSVDLEGNIIDVSADQQLQPELALYLKVFKDRQDVNALAHLYPPYICIYADRGRLPELPRTKEQQVKELIKVECRECPSRFTGLCSCRNDIRQSYAGADALLVKENGIITLAADLDSVVFMAQFLEDAARNSFHQNN